MSVFVDHMKGNSRTCLPEIWDVLLIEAAAHESCWVGCTGHFVYVALETRDLIVCRCCISIKVLEVEVL